MTKKKKKVKSSNNYKENDLKIKKVDEAFLEELKETNKEDIIETNDEYDKNLYIKTKKYNMIEPFIVIVAVLICFIILYKLIIVSNRTIINTLVNSFSNNLVRILDNLDDINFDNSYSSSTELTFTTSNSIFNKYEDYKYIINTNYNGDKKKIDGTINIKSVDNNNILSILYKFMDNNLYLKSNDLYYYPININLDFNSFLNLDYNTSKELLINIKNIILENLTFNVVNKKKEDITIDNETVNVKNTEIYYSKEEVSKIINNIIDDIEKDKNLISKILEVFNITEDKYTEVTNVLRNTENEFKINIYTKGLLEEIVGFKISLDNNEIFSSYLLNGNNIYTILYDNEPLKIIIDRSSRNLKVYYSDVNLLELKEYTITNDNISFDYDINTIVDRYNGKIKFNKISENNYELDFTFISANNKSINGDIKLETKIEDYKIESTFDVSDSVNLDDLSLDDYLEITGKFIAKMSEPIFIIN